MTKWMSSTSWKCEGVGRREEEKRGEETRVLRRKCESTYVLLGTVVRYVGLGGVRDERETGRYGAYGGLSE